MGQRETAGNTADERNWREALYVYTRPRVVGMAFLGFSSGLPFLLVFSTLSAWLTQAGISRATIGFFSWVGITYSIKVFWAPVVDRLPIPLLTRALGRRRSWMLLGQAGIMAGLWGMASSDPQADIVTVAWFALLVAFSSATQDVSMDAYRIEAVDLDLQGAMAATYQMGYRIALLVAGAGAFFLASATTWHMVYRCMAILVSVGMLTVLIVAEPRPSVHRSDIARERRVVDFLERSAHLPQWMRNISAWFIGAVVCPFTDFFSRKGALAVAILAFVALFRVTDITMGVMSNPFYLDMGYSLDQIASVAKIFGVLMTIIGAGLGGLLVARFGVMRPLVAGAILAAATDLLFAALAATSHPHISYLAAAISADNLSGGLAGSAFIAYLSGLTSPAYTATQYALFSSLMTLPGKFLGGFSGIVVQDYGYILFFTLTALAGLPAIALSVYLLRREPRAAPAEGGTDQ